LLKVDFMKPAVRFAGRVSRFTIAVGVIVLMISLFNWYQVRTAENAASFAPASSKSVLVPERTIIDAVIRNGLAKSTAVGDTITAFVTTLVSINESTVIPPGAQLRGTLEELSVGRRNAKVTVNFTVLLIEDRKFTIQTRPVQAIIPVLSDTQVFAGVLKALTGAGLGTAIGAASGDPALLNRGLAGGATSSLSQGVSVPVKVVLIRGLNVS